MERYLKDIPPETGETGISKVLLVRHESIEIKHILTEVFHKESVILAEILTKLGMPQFEYMKYITNRLRRIYKLKRFVADPNVIINYDFKSFFKYLELAKSVGVTKIVLDFDGVITSEKFAPLYDLCLDRCKTVVCSANPEINEERFTKRNLRLPHTIYANKGKIKKLRQLIAISRNIDYTFYVDDEIEYLDIAWLFGIKTFHYRNGAIYKHSLNSE